MASPPQTRKPKMPPNYGTHLGGVLTGDEIERLGLICNNFDSSSNKPASYDLRFGKEIFFCGRENNSVTKLDGDGDLFVDIKPFETIIFSTLEHIATPGDIVGRFGLKIGKGLSGLILQVGPQVEPLYTGPLFGLLLNTSGKSIRLSPGDRFLSIEFQKTGKHEKLKPNPKTITCLRDFLEGDQDIHLSDIARRTPIEIIEEKLCAMEKKINECRADHGLKVKEDDKQMAHRLNVRTFRVGRWALIVAVFGGLFTVWLNWDYVKKHMPITLGFGQEEDEKKEKLMGREDAPETTQQDVKKIKTPLPSPVKDALKLPGGTKHE